MRILIIEDEVIINNNIKLVFQASEFIVDQAFDGSDGLSKATINSYDCIILDIKLPKLTGHEVVTKLRNSGNKTPIIILSARDTLDDKTLAFHNGVDDYLVKPFELSVLVLKVKALLERINNAGTTLFRMGDCEFNTLEKTVKLNGKIIDLTSKELLIIEYLIANNNKYVSAEEILEHVWGESADSFSQTVKIHISNIRKKLGGVIKNKKGLGYKITAKAL